MVYKYNVYSAKKQKKAELYFSENLFDLAKVEWAEIVPNKTIVVTAAKTYLIETNIKKPSSLCKLLQGNPTNLIEGEDNITTTRKLLDSAIAAAKYTVSSNIRPPAMTSTRWVWRLAGSYHLCHIYPILIEQASRRFEEMGHFVLAQWAVNKIVEERGHEFLALQDIQSMGYDPEAVVGALIPSSAIVLMDYLIRNAQDLNPINCVGYSYTMERLALGIDEQYIQKIEDMLEQGINATRCLRTHSSVGADVEHVEETIAMVAKLPSSERIRIARACYETALMCFSPPKDSYISDAKLQQILNPLKVRQMQASNS